MVPWLGLVLVLLVWLRLLRRRRAADSFAPHTAPRLNATEGSPQALTHPGEARSAASLLPVLTSLVAMVTAPLWLMALMPLEAVDQAAAIADGGTPNVMAETVAPAISTHSADPVVPPRAVTKWRADPPVPPRNPSQRAEPPVPPEPRLQEVLPPAGARMPYLPGWVESEEGSRIWASPEPNAAAIGSVEAGQSLRVLGAQKNRLQIEYPDGHGWVNVRTVLPADAPEGRWLRAAEPVRLWPSAGPGAALALLPAASQLYVQHAEDKGRAHALAYDQHGRPLTEGWVAIEGLQPMELPIWALKRTPAEPRANVGKLFGSREAFIERVGAAAREASTTTQIPASVTVAQAILESNWGESRLAREAYNFFGIKAHTSVGPAGVVWLPTTEVVDSQEVRVVDVFRAYHSLEESVRDKHRFLMSQPRYRSALEVVGDPVEFAYRMWAAGYSTDPNYVEKLLSLIRQYNLSRFD